MRHAGRPYLPLIPGASFLFLLSLTLACTTKQGASSADRGALCANVGAVRACWECDGGKAPCVVGPATPSPRRAATFVCQGGDCVQRHPRLPDDGEWECIDQDGAVVCRGGEPAAGVIPGPPEVGWICGAREQGPRGPEKVCVDLAPDLPEGGPWRCRADHKSGEKRVCKQAAPKGPQLGEACGDGCPTGATCVSDRCLPAKPQPTCWFDTECAGGTCRQGTCVGGGA